MKRFHTHMGKAALGLALLAFLASGCASNKKKNVGNDRDGHGCIASAGYQWSELLQDCIRPFEKGIKLECDVHDGSISAVYLVFNADSSKIEAFLPKDGKNPILEKENGTETWTSGKHAGTAVKLLNGKWQVFLNGKSYAREKDPDSI